MRNMVKSIRSLFLPYAIAVLTVALALLLTMLMPLIKEQTPSSLFLAAVTVSAWYGGLRFGLLATALSILILDYFLLYPIHVLSINLASFARLAAFALVALLISSISAVHRRTEEMLREARQELEKRVEERTAELAKANEELRIKIAEQKRAEEGLRESEARFRQLAENIHEVFWMADQRAPQMIYVSPAYEQIWGRSCRSLYQQPRSFLDAVHTEDRQRVVATLERQMSGESTDEEYRIIRPDGSIRWIRDRAFPIKDESGQVYRVAGIAEDISERKRAEEEIVKLNKDLQRRVNELQALFDVIPVGIGIAEDPQCRYIKANPVFARLLAISPDVNASLSAPSYEKPPFKVCKDGRELSPDELPMQYAAATGIGVADLELDVVHEDGRVVKLLEYAEPLYDENGKIRGAVGAFLDITERKRAEEALRETNQTLQALIQASPLAVMVLDPDGIVKLWNPAAERIFGWSEQEALGRYLPAIPEDKHEEFRANLKATLETRTITGIAGMETRCQKKGGAPIQVSLWTAPLRDSRGQACAVMSIVADISERKREEEASGFLAEASAMLFSSLDYETTLTTLTRLIVPILADWCIVDIVEEDGTFRRLAINHIDPAKEELARKLQRHYPPDPSWPHGAPKVLRTGQSEFHPEILETELRATARDNEHASIIHELGIKSYMCVPLTAHGHTLGAISFVLANSDRRYNQKDLALAEDLARRAALAVDNARLYREAQEANRMKDEFLATVSHELRTPLTSMLGWARMLRSGDLDEVTSARAVETIERNARSQARLIEDLLDVSRILMGKFRLNIRPVELLSIIDAAIDAVRPAADAKAIRLQSSLDPEAGPVSGDPTRLQQVVWNLLSNAVKFTPSGGRVEIRLERVDGDARITVTDTGAGINPEFLPYVFDRFRQADSTTTRAHSGLGLGLAIVRHLVELHGGTVQAYSKGESQGATFTVSLPIIIDRSSAFNHHAPAFLADRTLPYENLLMLKGLRLMLVDDEVDTLDVLSTSLTRYGAQVKCCASADEALNELYRWKPDVLISDIGMPGEDGYMLISKVRRLEAERGGGIPAIALTAYAKDEDRARALSSGFQAYLTKPVEMSELATTIARLAGQGQGSEQSGRVKVT